MSIPTSNPPVPTDYEDLFQDWQNLSSLVIAANASTTFPATGTILNAPPVHGHGIVRVETCFSFELSQGSLTTCDIGVTNPSEIDYPMRPYVGVAYPVPAITFTSGQRIFLKRVDSIDFSQMPADIRSWAMNPGYAGGSGRAGYPSLGVNLTAGAMGATLVDLILESHAIQL